MCIPPGAPVAVWSQPTFKHVIWTAKQKHRIWARHHIKTCSVKASFLPERKRAWTVHAGVALWLWNTSGQTWLAARQPDNGETGKSSSRRRRHFITQYIRLSRLWPGGVEKERPKGIKRGIQTVFSCSQLNVCMVAGAPTFCEFSCAKMGIRKGQNENVGLVFSNKC